jgi:transposase-like protein
MDTNKRGRTPVYDNAFKVAIAREYLTSDLGKGALGKKYGLSVKTVDGFVRWYRKKYSAYPEQLVKDEPEEADNINAKQLLTQLKEANLKIAGLEILIEVTQKELGVDIIKKPGTKQ